MQFSVAIVGALIGAVILFFGRKLFWLCVAAVGFAAGVEIAPHLVHEPSPLLALAVALVLGLIGALLALFLQKVAVAVLGFLAGGKLAGAIAAAFFVHYAQYSTVIFLIGGAVGAILLLALFDWALIVVSSLIGAHLIQSAIVLPASGSTIVFIGLAVLGIPLLRSSPVQSISTDKLKRTGNNARMNSPTTGLRIASIIFALFALGHLLRLIKHAQVIVGSHTIPMGVSWVALIVAAILCIWMWRLSSSRGI